MTWLVAELMRVGPVVLGEVSKPATHTMPSPIVTGPGKLPTETEASSAPVM